MTEKKTELLPPEDPVEAVSSLDTTRDFSVEALLLAAVDKNLDPDGIEKLVDLKLKLDANQAEKKFNAALMAFQSECPTVPHSKHVKIPNGPEYSFAELDHLVTFIRPYLNKHNLSFDQDQTWDHASSTVTVMTTIRHGGGHSILKHFSAPIPKNVKVNDTQKTSMATTTAQRRGLALALGVQTAQDPDKDFNDLTPKITAGQVTSLDEMIERSMMDRVKFLELLGAETVPDIKDTQFNSAMGILRNRLATAAAAAASEGE